MLKTVICLLFFLTFVNMVVVSLALAMCAREPICGFSTSSGICSSINSGISSGISSGVSGGASAKAQAIAAQVASATASKSAREATAAFLGM